MLEGKTAFVLSGDTTTTTLKPSSLWWILVIRMLPLPSPLLFFSFPSILFYSHLFILSSLVSVIFLFSWFFYSA